MKITFHLSRWHRDVLKPGNKTQSPALAFEVLPTNLLLVERAKKLQKRVKKVFISGVRKSFSVFQSTPSTTLSFHPKEKSTRRGAYKEGMIFLDSDDVKTQKAEYFWNI